MRQAKRRDAAKDKAKSSRRAKEIVGLPDDLTERNKQRARRRVVWMLCGAAAILLLLLFLGIGAKHGFWRSPYTGLENTISAPDASQKQSVLTMHAIDVGQGDCTLILCDGCSMLVDAGDYGYESRVLDYLAAQGVGKLDYIVATHPHSDHIGGLPAVLAAHGAAHVLMPRLTQAQTPTTESYRAFLDQIKQSGATVLAAEPGAVFSLGEATVTVLGPIASEADSLNDMSVVLRVDFRSASILLAGDMEYTEEATLLENNSPLRATVLKVGHHGSSFSSTDAFLQAVSPKIAVIECGADNDYGHPHEQLLDRLSDYAKYIYRTDLCGNITLMTDGETWSAGFEKEREQ
ncbi:MAG: MBL fold metallo-hydrolase [Clostridia bacterium]|nr:MBL fold metallo-hydrolase [Clostridia bacterium]